VSAGPEVAIIDSGGANLASLRFALERLGARSIVSSEPAQIARAARVLLPGVGAAGNAMQRLRAQQLHTLIPQLTAPLLGICLGMQLLFTHSEEGDTPCLGVLDGTVERLRSQPGRPVPHMGWNTLGMRRPDPLLDGLGIDDHVYFVHSFAVPAGPPTLATTDYGGPISAVVRRANFYGVQFHPERSSAAGARILRNFLQLAA
jgi:imidazole glycerol-phosphate synthase subunit HisH